MGDRKPISVLAVFPLQDAGHAKMASWGGFRMLNSLESYAMKPEFEIESAGFADFLITVGGLAGIIGLALTVAWLVL
jgi:hypothetical protein